MRRRATDLNNAMTTRVFMRHSGTVAVEVKPAIELRPATLGIVQRKDGLKMLPAFEYAKQ